MKERQPQETKFQENPVQDQHDESKFGDDPNAIDRMKIVGLSELDGKLYQQVGDEFVEYDEPTTKEKS
jgi:hypothetical protein